MGTLPSTQVVYEIRDCSVCLSYLSGATCGRFMFVGDKERVKHKYGLIYQASRHSYTPGNNFCTISIAFQINTAKFTIRAILALLKAHLWGSQRRPSRYSQ